MSTSPGPGTVPPASGGPAPDVTPSPRRSIIVDHPLLVLGGVLIALVAATTVIEPGYLTVVGVRNTLIIAAPLAIIAGSQTLTMLTGGIDLSVAITATGAAYVAGNLSPDGALVAIAAGLFVGLVVGAVNGIGVGLFHVHPIIMTLGMSTILLGLFTTLAQGLLQGSTRVAPLIRTLGAGTLFGVLPWSLILLVVIATALILGLARTGLGRMIYAVGDNPVACRFAGVRVWQVLLVVYVFAGALAAVAGMLLAGRSGAVDLQLASSLLLPSVAAAVVGGTSIFGGWGGYSGTILGALILGVLDSMLTFLNAGVAIQQMLYGSIVLGLAWLYARATAAA